MYLEMRLPCGYFKEKLKKRSGDLNIIYHMYTSLREIVKNEP